VHASLKKIIEELDGGDQLQSASNPFAITLYIIKIKNRNIVNRET